MEAGKTDAFVNFVTYAVTNPWHFKQSCSEINNPFLIETINLQNVKGLILNNLLNKAEHCKLEMY